MTETARGQDVGRPGADPLTIAYLVQSHTDVAQVRRLRDTLRTLDPTCRVYVSHDERGEPGIEDLADDTTSVVRDPGGRAEYHYVTRWARAVEQVRDDGGADFVVLLSGQDYPVRPLDEMHDELRSSGDGFLETFAALHGEESHWPLREGRARYLYRWRSLMPLSEGTSRRLHLLHGLNYLQPFVRVNVAYGRLRLGLRGARVPEGLECRGGSMFHTLSWRAAEHVLRSLRTRPDVVAWARSSLIIDEALVQTLVSDAPELEFVPSSRRYYRFEDSHFGHPKTLTAADVPDALASGAYFARKFALRTHPDALDAVDAALGLPVAG